MVIATEDDEPPIKINFLQEERKQRKEVIASEESSMEIVPL